MANNNKNFRTRVNELLKYHLPNVQYTIIRLFAN